MSITIQDLQTMVSVYGTDKIQQLLSTFKSRNDDVESFLLNKALRFDKENISRIYLLLEDSKEKTLLRGYISLNFKSIEIQEDNLKKLSNRKRKKLGISPNENTFIAMLIGQYGKNQNTSEPHSCDPKQLLAYAVQLSSEIQKKVGGLTTVLLECEKNNQHLAQYYIELGFQPLQINENLNQFYVFISKNQLSF